MSGIEATLLDMRQPDNAWRRQFEAALPGLIDRLQTDPGLIARGERLKDEFIASPVIRDYVGAVWQETRKRVLADAERPDSLTKAWLASMLATAGARIYGDPVQRATVNGWIIDAAMTYVVPHRRELGSFIASVVQRWDVRTFVDKLETQVGSDLQFIRINGAVVGGLVGLLLYGLQHFVG
jgi:uncharacterized membrane-anchored protein YjiN (DUF445 family)